MKFKIILLIMIKTVSIIHLILFISFLSGFLTDDSEGRVFDFSLKLKSEINLSSNNIFRPGLISVNDSNGDLVIYSYASHTIKYKRSASDKFIEFGEGKGGGPREFQNPTDVTFDPQGNFWLADPHQARISIWSPDSGLIRTFNHESTLSERITVASEFYALKLQSYSSRSGLLKLISRETDEVIRFGLMPDEMEESNLLMDAELASDESSVYLGMYYSGMLNRYDTKGNLLYSISTIEEVETTELEKGTLDQIEGHPEISDVRYKKIPDESIKAVVDLDVNDSLLIVLFAGNNRGVGHFLDIYDKENGKYRDSVDLREFKEDTFLELDVVNNLIYLRLVDENGDYLLKAYELL